MMKNSPFASDLMAFEDSPPDKPEDAVVFQSFSSHPDSSPSDDLRQSFDQFQEKKSQNIKSSLKPTKENKDTIDYPSIQDCRSSALSFSQFDNNEQCEEKQEQKHEQIEKSDEQDGYDENAMIVVNQSIFTDRQQKKFSPSPPSKELRQSKKKEQDQQDDGYDPVAYAKANESYYMKPDIEIKKIKMPQSCKSKVNQRQQPNNQEFSEKFSDGVCLEFRGTHYFLQYGKISVQITSQTFSDLYEEFVSRNYPIPLFNSQIYQSWSDCKDKQKYSPSFDLNIALKNYIDRYLEYLNENYQKEIIQILAVLMQIQQGKQIKNSERKSYSYFQFFQKGVGFSQIFEYLKKKISESKTDLTKRTILSKNKSLQAIISSYIADDNSNKIDFIQQYKQRIKKNFFLISKLELLKSFEQTEDYCNSKLETNLQKKFKQFWLVYRDKIRKDKNKLIQQSLSKVEI